PLVVHADSCAAACALTRTFACAVSSKSSVAQLYVVPLTPVNSECHVPPLSSEYSPSYVIGSDSASVDASHVTLTGLVVISEPVAGAVMLGGAVGGVDGGT